MPSLPLFFYVVSACFGASAPAFAQEPEPAPRAEPQPQEQPPPERQPQEQEKEKEPEQKPEKVTALVGGTVHPVSGPAIENGVVLVRGERIAAVGAAADVAIPDGTVRIDVAGAHVYPGLVDALTDAFTDAALRSDGSLDAAAALADGLRPRHDREDELAAAGITTAYVAPRAPVAFRGQGAVVRPLAAGFEPWKGRERAALHVRMTAGHAPSHALQRQQQFDAIASAFDALTAYAKTFADHEKALAKYTTDFEAWLAWHRKKNGKDEPAGGAPGASPGEARPEGAPRGGEPRPGGEGRRGRRGSGGGGGGGEGRDPNGGGAAPDDPFAELRAWLATGDAPQDPPPQPNPAPQPAQNPQQPANAQGPPQPAAKPDDKPPQRPQYPKEPPRDPVKDALQQVIDGKLALRAEAHRPDEVRQALRLRAVKNVPVLVLEAAYGCAGEAETLAANGVAVVLTDVLPGALPAEYEAFEPTALPAQLERAGVAFAIASGSARRASLLPLMAAAAVGRGLSEAAALRAITLTPAEILGVAADAGSLEPGKYADVLVCDRPLFASDARVLRVLGRGETLFEAKR